MVSVNHTEGDQMDDRYDFLCERAYQQGHLHGCNSASWYFDGNTSTEEYARVLQGIRDGDPAVYDTFPVSSLSGEWVDEYSLKDPQEDLGITDEEVAAGMLDDVADHYDDGFGVAVSETIEATALLHAWQPVDDDARYGHAGVAWYIVAQSPDGSEVDAIMVGDDATHRLRRDDLQLLDEDDYCSECGQIGCRGDGRA